MNSLLLVLVDRIIFNSNIQVISRSHPQMAEGLVGETFKVKRVKKRVGVMMSLIMRGTSREDIGKGL